MRARQGHDLNPAVGAAATALTAHLAPVAGVLIEVPVMPSVVRIVNASRTWRDRKAGVPSYWQRRPAP